MNINLRYAVDAMNQASYKPLNTVDYEEGDYFLPDMGPSPEQLLQKKEVVEKLPKESLMIFQLISNMPSEILEELTCGSKFGKGVYTGRKKFISFIKSHFNWKKHQIDFYLDRLKEVI